MNTDNIKLPEPFDETSFRDALEERVNQIRLTEVIKKYFSAYETKDKDAIHALLGANFAFTSPTDDHIGVTEYFERCWPFSNEDPGYKLDQLIIGGHDAFVIYECETRNKKKIRNTEFFRFDNYKIASIEVFFGPTLHG